MPSTRIEPESGTSKPAIRCNSVVFPPPLWPINATCSPLRRSRSWGYRAPSGCRRRVERKVLIRSVILQNRLSSSPHCSLQSSVGVSFLQRLAFVVQFLSFDQTHHAFGDSAIVEIDTQRDQRQSTFVGPAGKLVELAGMDQQFSWAARIVVPHSRHCCSGRCRLPISQSSLSLTRM